MPTVFENMTYEEKVVAIAKDVLKHLDVTAVAEGTYLSGRIAIPDDFDDKSQLQIVEQEITKCCQVCALGACFLSHVRLFDHITLADCDTSVLDFSGRRRETVVFRMDLGDIEQPLRDYFDCDELRLIEAAFECDRVHAEDLLEEHAMAAEQFGRRHGHPRRRLEAIMKNIIANNGHFVLPKDLIDDAKAELALYGSRDAED